MTGVCPIERDARQLAALAMLAYIECGGEREDALVVAVPVAARLLGRLDFGSHYVEPELALVTDAWLNARTVELL